MVDTTGLLLGLVFGSIGVGYCFYGRKQQHRLAFWLGIALMALPYIVDSNSLLVVISIVLMILPFYIKTK